MRILFVSAEVQHTSIFSKVTTALEDVVDSKVETLIVEKTDSQFRPFSLKLNLKKEIQYVEQVVDEFKPDVLVVANDMHLRALFIKICKLKGIPSIAIQDGILANKPTSGVLSRHNYSLWRLISVFINTNIVSKLLLRLGRYCCSPCWGLGDSTIIAAMGDYYKQVFILEVIPEKIAVTGYSLLDELPKHRSRFDSNLFRENIGISHSKPLVLLITQPFVEDGLWTTTMRSVFIKNVIQRCPKYRKVI